MFLLIEACKSRLLSRGNGFHPSTVRRDLPFLFLRLLLRGEPS